MTVLVYFLRHGKAVPRSSWEGDDGARPLTQDGERLMRREAVGMERLGLGPDVIVTSPLVRARRTAEIVAERLGMTDRMVEDLRLAHGFDRRSLKRVAADHGDGAQSLMVVGHEPELSATVAELIGGGFVEMKKGALACVRCAGPDLDDGALAWLLTSAHLAGD